MTSKTASITNPQNIILGISIPEMAQLGKYRWMNPSLINDFQLDPTILGTAWEFQFLVINERIDISKETIKSELEGWEIGKIDHSLALGAQHPDMQKQFTILAIGSILNGDMAPALYSVQGEREFGLVSYHGSFASGRRILRVRQIT